MQENREWGLHSVCNTSSLPPFHSHSAPSRCGHPPWADPMWASRRLQLPQHWPSTAPTWALLIEATPAALPSYQNLGPRKPTTLLQKNLSLQKMARVNVLHPAPGQYRSEPLEHIFFSAVHLTQMVFWSRARFCNTPSKSVSQHLNILFIYKELECLPA